MDVIQSPIQATATPEIQIDFSPQHEAFSYSVGSTVYAPAGVYFAHVWEDLTYTATVILPNPDDGWIVSYEWDFGDGNQGFENPVTHFYTQANSNLQVSLTITDNLNRRWSACKAMYIIVPEMELSLSPSITVDASP